MVRHVDEMLRVEDAGLPEVGFVDRALAGDHLGMKEFDPFAVGGLGDLTGITAVAREEVEVLS